MNLLYAAGLGFGLGVATGMPLGVINIAIIDAVANGRQRFATGLGLGGGVADAGHAMLAFAGLGRLMIADPALVRDLAIVAAITIVSYAVITWRNRARVGNPRGPRDGTQTANDSSPIRGLATGIGLTLPNPAALAAWVAVAAALWPGATLLEATLLAAGVGVGSALWFTTLARWVGRVRRDHPLLTLLPRVAMILLTAIAVAGVVRTL